ncbi:Uncharacterised protein [Escherichia coli]|uniref:Uncharacterized protein n=1 Tax=Escherichia coli TaxID=562 RepID=A0A377BXT8_ECOLX|nr:Uncharacterised protein [Escherichia coli]
MSTQNLAQRSVHQVRCGVIQTNTGTTSLINISLHRVAHFQRTRSKFTDVTNRLAVFLRIFHRKGEVSAFQFAFIANLTRRIPHRMAFDPARPQLPGLH